MACLVLLGCDDPVPPDPAPTTPSADLARRPVVVPPAGAAPGELVVEDLVAGEGEAVRPGDRVVVQYVGVGFASGETFDSSWDRGSPLAFRVGQGRVVEGLEVALVGDPERAVAPMQVGGRRRVVVPPGLAYGPQPPPGLDDPGDATLVVVVDLVATGPPP